MKLVWVAFGLLVLVVFALAATATNPTEDQLFAAELAGCALPILVTVLYILGKERS
jgi:uncharacterized membrane protein